MVAALKAGRPPRVGPAPNYDTDRARRFPIASSEMAREIRRRHRHASRPGALGQDSTPLPGLRSRRESYCWGGGFRHRATFPSFRLRCARPPDIDKVGRAGCRFRLALQVAAATDLYPSAAAHRPQRAAQRGRPHRHSGEHGPGGPCSVALQHSLKSLFTPFRRRPSSCARPNMQANRHPSSQRRRGAPPNLGLTTSRPADPDAPKVLWRSPSPARARDLVVLDAPDPVTRCGRWHVLSPPSSAAGAP